MVRQWAGAVLLTAALTACADLPLSSPSGSTPTPGTVASAPTVAPPTTAPIGKPTPAPTSAASKPAKPSKPSPTARRSATAMRLGIPELGVSGLRVVAYNGTADDRPGTRIQDRGVAASPRGPRGGAGPGEIGNFIVTAHRTTHGRPFGRLPELRNGDHILVTADQTVYDYVVVQTMTISFREPAEIAQQNAAVPGRPGLRPTRAMITLSTCATPEDHAQGNYWKDALGNPEHRINKIGVLTATRPA